MNNACETCGGDWTGGSYDHIQCLMKLMANKAKAKELATILNDVMSTGFCRAANNEERLMIFRAAVRYAEKIKRVLWGIPEPKETAKARSMTKYHSLMTLKDGGKVHNVAMYDDDTGYGSTSCGIQVLPCSVTFCGPVSCPACKGHMDGSWLKKRAKLEDGCDVTVGRPSSFRKSSERSKP